MKGEGLEARGSEANRLRQEVAFNSRPPTETPVFTGRLREARRSLSNIKKARDEPSGSF